MAENREHQKKSQTRSCFFELRDRVKLLSFNTFHAT